MEGFKDHFSKQSPIYKQYRPDHPDELIQYLASLCKEHHLVWDCGTGNGQAAAKLAEYFERVYATDASQNQLHNASPHPKVEYVLQRAEDCTLADASVDLVTVAVALHWFHFEEFYQQVKRVLKPGGILAAWTYVLPIIDRETDALISDLHYHTLTGYWLPENELGEKEYATIPFPFEPIQTPDFYFSKHFHRDDLLGYLRSWSAVQRFMDENKSDPLTNFERGLKKVWPDTLEKNVTWKVILKVGHT